jgi:hypothetical protein
MSWLISKALMNSLSLPEPVEEFLGDISSDGEQSVQSSGNPIPQAYCARDKMTAFSRLSRFGMTFKPLTEDLGEELCKLYREAFLVRTFPLPEKDKDLKVNDPECGSTWRGWLAKYDHNTSSWRTPQCSLLEEELELLETLPKWGMTVNGLLWELPTLMPHINETECGFSVNWPTPVHSEARQGLQIRREGKKGSQVSLSTAVLTWPTPTTKGMSGGSGSWDLLNKNTTIQEARLMGAGNGGQLNPTWVEWLMGWPLGWTDLKPLGTDKSLSAPLQLGEC